MVLTIKILEFGAEKLESIPHHKNLLRTHPARPSVEYLYDMLKMKSFSQLGRDYGVNPNTIKHWCRVLGIPDNRAYYENKYGKINRGKRLTTHTYE